MQRETLVFDPADLWRKHGFGDGYVLMDVDFGKYEKLWEAARAGKHHRDVLVHVVRTLVIPRLNVPVETKVIVTSHNPIRAVDWENGPPADLQPREIEISLISIIRAAREV